MILYCLFRKSCTSASGWIPTKSNGAHDLFKAPLYLQRVTEYRKSVRVKAKYTLSRAKHISSLFTHGDNSEYYYGDSNGDALLCRIEQLTMEIYVFKDNAALSESFYMNVDKLPANEIRLQARSVTIDKYQRQLLCYQGKQVSFLGI